jgi:carboxyl-terminal processing protease
VGHRPLRTFDSQGNLAVSAPLAVLVDHRSASASEVVAGALKDYARATIIGASTFGKSLVQQIYQLPSGAALKLTVARYLTPAGYVISHGGIQPDIRSRHALAAALRFFSRRRS